LIVAAGTKLAMEHYHVANEEWVELREVAPERGDAQRWVLEDETAWEVDTTKEFKIYNSKADKWLYAESDTVPRVGAWSDSSRQIWRLTKVQRTADGRQIYSVVSAHPGGKALSMPNVANDQPLTLGGANDKWHVTRMDGGAFRLRAEGVGGGVRFDMSTRGPGDAEGLVTAYQEVWNEHGANQEWVLIDKRECTIVPGARYAIISDAGLALTDEPGADSQHGTVTLREADNRPQQAWRFIYDAVTEAFSVVVSNTANTNIERVLEVEDDSMAEGARVQTNDRRVQQWRPASYVGQQKYTLASRGSGLVLDATSDQDGCDIVQWSANGERHQTFHLVELHDGRTISTEGVVTLDFTPVTIKSIKVPAGLRVTLYDGPRLTGATRVLLEDAQDLGAFKVASMFVEPVATLRSGGGATWYLGIGEYTKAALGDLGVGYGVLSSIDVPQGMQVELFDADDFAGEQRVISFGAPSLADVGVGAVQSIRVKAAGVVVPREALRYGDVISLRAQRSDTGQLTVKPDRPWPLVAWGNGGPQTQFRVVRAGTTRFKDLVCYGDVIGLQSLHAKDTQGYLYVSVASSGATKCEYQGPQAPAQFVLVRAASGTSRTFVSRGDVLALFNESTKLYISANDGQGQELKAMGELKSWEGWKVDQVWPVDAPSAATQSASVDGSPSAEAVQSPSFLEPGSPGSFSPLRLVGPRWAVGPSERSITCVEDACGAAVCVADGGMLSVCGAAATGVGYCAVDITAVGACGAAFALQAICGVDVAGLGLCGTAASGVALCGADLCGAAACGAAACGGALCGAAACGSNAGNGMCGVDTCSVDGSIVNACPADICGANACLINLCPADVCAADACLIDLIPVIPGI
jgi:hypothetical protein